MSIFADPAGTLGLVGGAVTSISALAHKVMGSWSSCRIEAERQETVRQLAGELVHAQPPGAGVVAVRYSKRPPTRYWPR